ncbi:hypothetical protein KIPB_001368 [Kipferlia bialata]|uniref:Uncharacterized protein n=1 Tax=Kipferlia bialata TaxID=797122 RepID=A0A391NIP5_9EUKA|nr:hypothetical protein KIPB_001368 [Kipferlia bialata]|eukprot:g1368.t1
MSSASSLLIDTSFAESDLFAFQKAKPTSLDSQRRDMASSDPSLCFVSPWERLSQESLYSWLAFHFTDALASLMVYQLGIHPSVLPALDEESLCQFGFTTGEASRMVSMLRAVCDDVDRNPAVTEIALDRTTFTLEACCASRSNSPSAGTETQYTFNQSPFCACPPLAPMPETDSAMSVGTPAALARPLGMDIPSSVYSPMYSRTTTPTFGSSSLPPLCPTVPLSPCTQFDMMGLGSQASRFLDPFQEESFY